MMRWAVILALLYPATMWGDADLGFHGASWVEEESATVPAWDTNPYPAREAMRRMSSLALNKPAQTYALDYTLVSATQNVYHGAVAIPDGRVVLVPNALTVPVGLLDPSTFTYTAGPNHTATNPLVSSAMFYGGVLLDDGRVAFIPGRSPHVGIYDPVANTYTAGPDHNTTNQLAFYGGAKMPDGRVLFAPYYSQTIGIYDPVSNTYSNGPAHGRQIPAYRGAVTLLDGRVLLVPHVAAAVAVYDPAGNALTHISGVATGYHGGVLHPSGKVVLIPRTTDRIRVFDPASNSLKLGPLHGQGSDAFGAGVLLPDRRVLMIPHASSSNGFYDVDRNTFTTSASVTNSAKWFGGVLTTNGSVVLAPFRGVISVITNVSGPVSINQDAVLSPLINKL